MSNNSNTRARRRTSGGSSSEQKKTNRKRFFWIITLLIILIVAGGGCGFISATLSNLPDVSNVRPSASSQIYDVHGNLITTVHSVENRLPVPLKDVPKDLQDAFIATEDSRFYSHHGIDPIGILRAVWVNIIHSGVSEGGSTITQQLARGMFLTQDRTLKRKISEALLAIKIEQNYTKQEILEMYMNQIYFGQGAYGVQSASHVYFGKDVQDLTLAQAALIAGLPQSPNYYSPFNNLEESKKRQAIVLGQMVKYGYITQEQADEARQADLGLIAKQEQAHEDSNASYFINYVISQVSEKYGDDAIYKDGLKIYTTLDMNAQNAAVAAMQNLPSFYNDQNGLQQPQGAIVAMNPHNGYIVAMVGGRGDDAFNRATQAERQPGSAMKPFVYLAAIQSGKTPGSIVDDSPVDFNGWRPQNYEKEFNGEITYRYALQHSVNVATIKIADEIGMSKILRLAKDMGITTLTDNDNNLSTAIGGLTHGVTPLEMAQAYGVLANGGIKVQPTAIVKIVDRNGQIVEENSIQEKRIIEEKDAAILTNMLESVINGGTGGNAAIGRPVAGKTGTTDDSKDAWFVGYTPDLVAAVWMGDDYGTETLHGITGGTTPAIIWAQFMSNALANTPVSDFSVPASAQSAIQEGYRNPVKETPKQEEVRETRQSSERVRKDEKVKEEEKPSKEEASDSKSHSSKNSKKSSKKDR
ncbi:MULTISPECIES: transglycosylase domain-containing protein [Veillonella]|uniref:Penicillin-binding protein 1A n=1 Tax=Veillonella denticariosi JCM 15641 TaxID=1298594 RepID=A0A2S7Z7J9_9FIRM|nr:MULTISPECIES: penicillin-binding protein 1A [Veillonella]ETS93696.1 putative penicillin-binding protein 1B [Veillonella sp. AS16]PQL19240.1 penicillin-binding protein 1A [Veillonella denticariosi JCM 15641]